MPSPVAEPEGVVVLGVPRSGTTLVRRILDAHPAIRCPPETNLLGAAARFLREDPFAGGMAVGVVPGLGFSGFAEEEVLARLREFVFSFFRDAAAKAGKPRWAEKTAVDVFHLDAVERLCGDRCRYVCVFRHPLDDACSIKELSDKMEAYLPELHAYVARHPAPLEAFCHAWAEANRKLLDFAARRPGLCVKVRYEDLAAAPAPQVARMFEALGEPVDADALLADALGSPGTTGLGDWKTYATREVSDKSVGRWKALSPWTVRRLAAIVNPLAAELGYEPLPEGPAAPAADDRRAEELGRLIAGMKMKMGGAPGPRRGG